MTATNTTLVESTLTESIATLDPEIAERIDAELARQQRGLEMIASENHTALAVMQAQGSVLTNKYAEGYPGKRYYGGCEEVDVVETLAIERVKALFGAEFANVQPHSGAQANASVMHALIRPGDTVMGLNLAHGGHLTHGMKINFSGRLYNIVPYGVEEDTLVVDMDKVEALAIEHQPEDDRRRLVRLPAPAGLRTSSARSRTRSARTCSWTWPTSPAWSPPGCTPPRCRTPTWSPPPRTRPWPVRAAGSS